MTSTRTIGPRTLPRPFNPCARDVAETPNGRRPLASRRAHEDRAAQEREGPERRQEPFVPGHQPEQRRFAEAPDHRRRDPARRQHAGPRTPHGQIDVLHPRGTRGGDVGSREESPPACDGGVLPRRLDARDPQRREDATLIPVVPRAAVRNRGAVQELEGARRPGHDGRLTGDSVTARRATPGPARAIEAWAHDGLETDDDVVRAMQDELHEAEEKLEVYRSDASLARTWDADVQHTERTLATLSQRIATRRAEITEESWASETFAGLREIPVASQDRSFVSVRKEDLSRIAPRLAAEIPKKSHLWADWTVWNFRRRPVQRANAMPVEALRRTQASLAYFERLEVWHAVGMADPWLLGGVRLPSNRERFYLLYDWGTETTADRQDLR